MIFRVLYFSSNSNSFEKARLEHLSNISLENSHHSAVAEEYEQFLNCNLSSLTLKLSSEPHVKERSFRLFSWYNRHATYCSDDDTFELKIEYLKFDEDELINDILSLGDRAVVVSPDRIKNIVLEHINRAYAQY